MLKLSHDVEAVASTDDAAGSDIVLSANLMDKKNFSQHTSCLTTMGAVIIDMTWNDIGASKLKVFNGNEAG